MQYVPLALVALLSSVARPASPEALPGLSHDPPNVGRAHGIAGASEGALSDGEIRRLLIKASIAAYDGSCPCPYNHARNGSRCGKRSAYDREGGEGPLCYERDVGDEMVREYRASRGRD